MNLIKDKLRSEEKEDRKTLALSVSSDGAQSTLIHRFQHPDIPLHVGPNSTVLTLREQCDM